MKIIKIERLDVAGNLICEYCGRPMVRAYDVIGHHIKELTEENVNDYSISLNPENIQLLHHACHNAVHERFGGSRIKQVFVVHGSPLSGKTTWVKKNKKTGDFIIDIDNIWQSVSGEKRYVKPKSLKPIVFKIRDAEIEAAKYRLGSWKNCYVIQSLPLSADRERISKELRARLIHIDTPRNECLERLEEDDERNKTEWKEYIEEYFATYC